MYNNLQFCVFFKNVAQKTLIMVYSTCYTLPENQTYIYFSSNCARMGCCWSAQRRMCYRPIAGKLESLAT